MTICVTLNESGHVARVRVGGDPISGALEVVLLASGDGFTASEGEVGIVGRHAPNEIAAMMRDGDLLVPRPVSPVPTLSGGVVTIPPVPNGTVIEVFDLSGGERMTVLTADEDDWTETITLADPGEYEIEVQAPGDCLMSALMVTI